MKRILIFNILLVFLSVVLSFSVQSYDDIFTPEENYDPGIEIVPYQETQDYEYQHEQQSVKSHQLSENVNQNGYSIPTSIHPIYIKVQDGEAIRERDNLKISIGISTREKRERKFTRFNSSTPPLINPSLNTTLVKGVKLPITSPKIYNVTIIPRPLPLPEPLIMVRNLTKVSTKSKLKKVPVSTRTSIGAAKNITSNIKSVITSSLLKGKPAKKHPPQPLLPPTGDVTEEEEDDEDEEEEEEDDASQGESGETQDSSEENDEDDEIEKEKPSKPQKDVKPPDVTTIKPLILPTNATQVVNPIPTKGDTGSSESVEDDADNKKKKKAKKKKKKGKKKAQLHFVPAPLGAKADIIVRLDKVHKNVREIFSVVKGVFTDYVIKRPHVNFEFYSKGHHHPDKPHDYHERSDIHRFVNPKSEPWNPPSWSKDYPKDNQNRQNSQSTFSKRFLENECLDDEICDEGEYPQQQHKPQRPNKGKPVHLSRVPLPYPIYLETRQDDSEEYSPFDDLPPLPPSYFRPKDAEKTWVRTWDKKKTGLPKIADSAEASKRIKHKHRH